MRVFVDTSAFLPLLNRSDEDHEAASLIWARLRSERASLSCTNYVLLESFALLQNRLGMEAVKGLQEKIVPLLQVEWIDLSLHQSGIAALLLANLRRLSLVDCTSFIMMRRLGIDTVFAFDQHFAEQGFIIARAS